MKRFFIILLATFFCALSLHAQKTKYPYSPSITHFFTDEQIDSLHREAAWEAFKANQVPYEIFEERYPILKDNIYSFSKKRINTQLGNLKNRYGTLSKIPKHVLEYEAAKDEIAYTIIHTIREDLPETPALAVLLNYQASDNIDHFHSDVTILPNGQLNIIETINIYNTVEGVNYEYTPDGEKFTVEAISNDIKRGIVRYIPETYYWKNGLNQSIWVLIDSITRNGKNEPFKNERKEGSRVLYIGDPNNALDAGNHTYKIYYSSSNIIHFDKDYDELYLNVNGTGWTMPIDTVSCTIHLPQGASSISNACYTGAYGSTESKCTNVSDYEKGTVTFTTTTPLQKGQGLTILTSWPKGFVVKPSKGEFWFWTFFTNFGPLFIFLVGIFLFVRAILIRVYVNYRQNRSGNVIPQFEPPQNLDPASMSFFLKKEHAAKNTIAALVDLAVYKYLAIEVEKQGNNQYYKIAHPKEIYKGRPANHHVFEKEALLLKDEIISNTKGNEAMGYFNNAVETYTSNFFFTQDPKSGLKTFKYLKSKKYRTWFSKFLFYTALLLSGALTIVHYQADVYTYTYFVIGLILTFLATFKIKLDFHLLTPEGFKLKDEINGFKLFLKTADEHRLDIVNRPDANLLLERYLPYAIALDCEMEWVEKFRDAIAPSLVLENDGLPNYYTPVEKPFATSAYWMLVMIRSDHLYYQDYMREKASNLRHQMPHLPQYPEIEIERPETSKRTFWGSVKDNADIPRDKTSWTVGGDYNSSSSSSSSSSSRKSSSPSRGGGFSGGGASGGGGGGW